jgi:Glycosyltransferase family 87
MRRGFGTDDSGASRSWLWMIKQLRYEGIGWPQKGGGVRLRGIAVAIAVMLTIWGYVDIGPRGRILPGMVERHQTDFTVFTEAGAAFFDGRDPYRVHNPRGWHYLYPPLFAILMSPLSALDTESQVLVWYFLNCVMAFGCFAEGRRLWRVVSAGVERRFARRVAACAMLTAVLPFLDCMQAGQLGIAILLLLLVGFRLAMLGRSWFSRFAGGLVLALPAAIKLVPALPVAFFTYQAWAGALSLSRWRSSTRKASALTAGVVTGGILYLIAAPAAVIGWQENLNYLDQWHQRIVANDRVGPNANFNIHSYRNQSLTNAVYLWDRSFGSEPVNEPDAAAKPDRPERVVHGEVRIAIAGLILLMTTIGFVVGRRGDSLDQAMSYSLACCAMLLVSPLAWGHYYMAEAPAVMLMPLWIWRRGMPRAATAAALIPVILTWAYYLGMGTLGAIGLLGLGMTGWFIAGGTLILGLEFQRWAGQRRGGGSMEIRGAKLPHFGRRSKATAGRREKV